MTAPVGYLVTVAIVATCTLSRSRRPWALGLLSYLCAQPVCELKFTLTGAHGIAVGQTFNAMPRDREGQPASYGVGHKQGISQSERLIAEGQRVVELRNFSTRVIAVTVHAAIGTAGYQLAVAPLVDSHDLACVLTLTHATTSAQPPRALTLRRHHERQFLHRPDPEAARKGTLAA